eukprot:TRINITY_DN30498_c0_g1_i1.p1 TRINITY_DN30498_c0_g1~~TRINITY_DN30498_c0_g1_i1.p1  ORF type:complete len:561 (+),score=123.38 TRINITY_DN30498_c0_g1_i1:127-1809(+)
MFEPARVRTLLQIRSSLPTRPSTSHARLGTSGGEERRPASAGDVGGDFARPSTAPPVLGAAVDFGGARAAVALGRFNGVGGYPPPVCTAPVATIQDEQEEEDHDEFDANPSEMISQASMLLYQLQNTWLEERRSEVGALWQSMEEKYGMTLPREQAESLFTSFRGGGDVEVEGDGSLSTADQSTTAASSAAAFASDGADEFVESSAAATAQADITIESAAGDLERVRALRQLVEDRISSSACGVPTVSSAFGSTSGATSWASKPQKSTARAGSMATNDAQRLAQLHKELAQLRTLAHRSPSPELGATEDSFGQSAVPASFANSPFAAPHEGVGTPTCADSSKSVGAITCSRSAGRPTPAELCQPAPHQDEFEKKLAALSQWVEDVREIADGPCTDGGGAAGEGAWRQPPTPLRRGNAAAHKSSPQLSKREMARIAEERAMGCSGVTDGSGLESGFANTGSCWRRAKKSPVRTPQAGSSTGKKGGIGAMVFSSSGGALTGGARTQVSPTSAAADKKEPLLPEETATDTRSAMERELDAILAECDEIDRIHDGICGKLNCVA